MFYHLTSPSRTILLHQLEEHLTMTESKLKHLFDELYAIRQQRIVALKDMTEKYLKSQNMICRFVIIFSYIWSLTLAQRCY